MKKSLKIFLFVVLAIVLVAVIVGGAMAIYTVSGWPTEGDPTEFTENWMSYVDDSTLLKNVVIPGSHDAGSESMMYMARTQERSIADQLKCGVRYFDLRVQKDGDNLYIFHDVIRGPELLPILRVFRDFLQNHPRETLILDFQHFKGQSQSDTCAAISRILGVDNQTLLIRNTSSTTRDDTFINSLTMSRARGKAIILWGSDSDEALDQTFVFKRNNDAGTRNFSSLQSYYDSALNKKSSDYYIANGLPQYIEKYKTENSGLFVLQGQLTDGLYVRGPQFREKTHNDNMNAYVDSLAQSSDLQYINIIMRDFVSSTKSCIILKLNLAKNVIKSADRETFAAGVNVFLPQNMQVTL